MRGSAGSILGSPATIGGSYALFPRVEAFGSRWLAVWEQQPTHDNRLAPEEKDLYYRRILEGGTLLDPAGGVRVTSAANSQFDPSAAWDGSPYVLGYTDVRSHSELDQHRGDLYGTRVAGSGMIVGPDGFAVANDSTPEMLSEVAGAGGLAILAGSVFVPEASHGALRIGYRILGLETSDVAGEVARLEPGLTVSPNPARGASRITLRLEAGAPASATVYDARGAEIRGLLDGFRPAGTVRLAWDGRDTSGRPVTPGLDFLRVPAGEAARTTKILRR